MIKKIKFVFLSIIILFFLFFLLNKKVASYIILNNLSKWTERTVTVDRIDIDYSKKLINLVGLKILNKPDFYDENIFEAKKITIEIKLFSLFSDLVLINKIILHEPRFFFEIKNVIKKSKKETIKDNLGLVEKIIEQTPSKIYPSKKKDKNFMILNSTIKNSKTFIRYPNSSKILTIKLSNMSFQNTGNSNPAKNENYQHYKDVLSLIMKDIYFRIPDNELRVFLKKNYKIK